MGGGFSVNLSSEDMKKLSEEYQQRKEEYEVYKKYGSCVDHACTYFSLIGFERALELVGIDPKIFDGIDTFL